MRWHSPGSKGGGYGKNYRISRSGKSSGQDAPLDAPGVAGQDNHFRSAAAQDGLICSLCGLPAQRNEGPQLVVAQIDSAPGEHGNKNGEEKRLADADMRKSSATEISG